MNTNVLRQLFKEQIEKNVIITEEVLSKLQNKTYHSGKDVKIGDKPLYALLYGKKKRINNERTDLSFTLIMINEGDIHLYDADIKNDGSDGFMYFPPIKLKKK